MIRRPPRSTLSSSSAASDVYKRQVEHTEGVGNGRLGIGAMQLIEIDPVRTESLQTSLDRLPHVARGGTPGTVLPYGTPELGGDDHLVTVPAQCLTQTLL